MDGALYGYALVYIYIICKCNEGAAVTSSRQLGGRGAGLRTEHASTCPEKRIEGITI